MQLSPPTAHEVKQPFSNPFIRQTFSALQHRNYRLWFAGQLVSLFGTWMQATAQGYLVFQMTKSSAYLGYVGFAAGLPSWLLMLYGGVVADRMPRRRLLLLTQTGMMFLAFALAILTFTNTVQPWHILILAFGLGIANAFDAPARQSFLLDMVDRENLTNAIALNSTMFNLATAFGPAIGGLTYSLFGPAWCFTINGLSFIAVITALTLMKLSHKEQIPKAKSAIKDLIEGLHYVARQEKIRLIILNLGMVSLFGFGILTLMPAWAVKILHGDSTTNGLLLSARGLGSMIAALMIASQGNLKFRGKVLQLGNLILPFGMFLFAVTPQLTFALVELAILGWSLMVLLNMSNALVQLQVPDELRGRVMGIYTLTFFGFMPLGALISGAVASRLNEQVTILINGVILLVFTIIMWFRSPGLRSYE